MQILGLQQISMTSPDGHTSIGIVLESRIADLKKKGVLESSDKIYNPKNMFRNVVLFTPYDEDLQFADELAVRGWIVVCHGGRVRRPWTLVGAVFRMIAAIRRYRIGLLRGSNVFLGTILASLAARASGIPVAAWMGGDNRIAQQAEGRWYYRDRRLTNAIEWVALRSVDLILVPNRFTRDYVRSIAGDAANNKVEIVPWPAEAVSEIEPDAPDIYEELSLPKDCQLVSVIGFLNRYKFTDVLFRMLESGPLASSAANAVFVFCGDGDFKQDGLNRFSDRSDVRFVGFQTRRVVHELIRQSAVVCVPMSGMVLLEAASAGRPIVTSNVEWHSEFIRDGDTGLIVDPTSPDAWRAAIEKLLSAPDAAARMAGRAKLRYTSELSREKCIDRLEAAYRRLLESKRRGMSA